MTELSTASFSPDGEQHASWGAGPQLDAAPLGRFQGGRALLPGGAGSCVIQSHVMMHSALPNEDHPSLKVLALCGFCALPVKASGPFILI